MTRGATLLLPALLAAAAGAQPAPLHPAGAIALPGVEGRIDHLAVDLGRQRLFVAALGNDSLEVLDLAAQRRMRSVGGLAEPQGVLYLADLDRVVVANGAGGTVDVFDGASLERVASVPVGEDADDLRYEPAAQRVHVAAADGALVALDARTWKVEGRVELPAHPEGFEIDAASRRAFVNLPGARRVGVVDLAAHSLTASWLLHGARGNFPMARVADAGLLLLGCRSPAELLVLSAATGAPVQTLPIAGDADDLFYDTGRRRAYVVSGAGAVDVFSRDEGGAFGPVDRVATAPGARTGLFVPERKQLFVAVPHRGRQRAEVRIFDVVQ